jgi:hypothetical protein
MSFWKEKSPPNVKFFIKKIVRFLYVVQVINQKYTRTLKIYIISYLAYGWLPPWLHQKNYKLKKKNSGSSSQESESLKRIF